MIQALFQIKLNDTTNAFKAYRRTAIDGCRTLIAPHFNLTVELPLEIVVRGYSWAVIPITWRNQRTGEPKLKLKNGKPICSFTFTYGLRNTSVVATTANK
jgi:dolichol-phosphate mannosyltransferase